MGTIQNQKKTDKKIILTGFGGQGIILAGRILGQAAALGDQRESTLVQSYGPESRGGACSAQVVISDEPIHYPYIKNPDILICMSQAGYDKFKGNMNRRSVLLVDQDLVQPGKISKNCLFSIPATRVAEDLGRKMMANIIMLGFTTSITNIISMGSALKAVSGSVPQGTEKNNIAAFNKGRDYGLSILKGRKMKAEGKIGARS